MQPEQWRVSFIIEQKTQPTGGAFISPFFAAAVAAVVIFFIAKVALTLSFQ